MRSYELMIIHRPEMADTDVHNQIGELGRAIAESGSVTTVDHWGKRRFAYEINHLTEGYYSVVSFEAELELVDRLDRALGLSDAVIRHKILRQDIKDVPDAPSAPSATSAPAASGADDVLEDPVGNDTADVSDVPDVEA